MELLDLFRSGIQCFNCPDEVMTSQQNVTVEPVASGYKSLRISWLAFDPGPSMGSMS